MPNLQTIPLITGEFSVSQSDINSLINDINLVIRTVNQLVIGTGVTSITAGNGLSGGTITGTGTIAVADSAANTLAGYDSAGAFGDVTLGSGLTLSGGILSTTGTSSGFVEITSDTTANINTGYITNSPSLVTITLPPSSQIGDLLEVVGIGSGGWEIAQDVGQQVTFGNQMTTSGPSGSLSSQHRADCLSLVCTADNTNWSVKSSIGNITLN